MRFMTRIMITLGFALLLALAGASVAFAQSAEVTGSVDYDGKHVNMQFSTAEYKTALSKMVPGDTVGLTVDLVNKTEKSTDWYLENKILKSFEEGAKATGGAYTYELAYTDPAGKTQVIYSSETVGGEGSQGLHDATSGMEDYFYLARIDKKAQGKLSISVTVDGETANNDYQQTLASINVNFGVEEVAAAQATDTEESTTAPGSGSNTDSTTAAPSDDDDDSESAGSGSSSGNNSGSGSLTRTGDSTRLIVLIILFVAAAAALAVVLVARRRTRGGSDEESV